MSIRINDDKKLTEADAVMYRRKRKNERAGRIKDRKVLEGFIERHIEEKVAAATRLNELRTKFVPLEIRKELREIIADLTGTVPEMWNTE